MEINSDLIKNNEDVLLQFNSNCIKRRIKRELEGLYKIYNNITLSINNSELKVSICEIINNKRQKYDFIMSQNYPFTCPKIFYQNRPYIDFLKVNCTKSEILLTKKVTGHECFCCHSLNCKDNWSPAITLQKIVNEIYSIKSYKRTMVNKLIADKIKLKYLIDDINLDEWLF
jgi:ubiquitin-protein ligase